MHVSGELPLHGRHVLITRAGEQSESFASALRALGARPLVAPTIAIAPLGDLSVLDDAIERIATFQWLVFTSQNAVDAFMPRLAARDANTAAVRVAAIGAQTAKRLREHGARVSLTAEQYVSEALARELVDRASPGERILIVRALDGREALPIALEAAGLQVTCVPAYRTVLARDPSFGDKVRVVDTVTFTSASTVRGFVSLLSGDAGALVRGKCVACIGPVTAQAARQFGVHVDVTAAPHTVDGLVDALRTHYGATA